MVARSVVPWYEAWQCIDVFDMHYMRLGTMQTIYAAAQKRGVRDPAVWQTEIGFTTEDKCVVPAIDLKWQNQANLLEDSNTGDPIHLNFGWPTMSVTFPGRRQRGVAGAPRPVRSCTPQ